MLEIRSFLNADLPRLADIWCIHHATYRSPPAVNEAIYEQAVAARLFFEPSRLLVAILDRKPIAWCQWFPGADGVGSLEAFCYLTGPDADAAANELLAFAERSALIDGMNELQVGVHFRSGRGYQGLDPVGHGVGVDVADDRTNTLLEAAGYQEKKRFDRWEVSTSNYRQPVSRDLLAIRRTMKIKNETVPFLTPEFAAGMIHFDVERYSLVDLRTNEIKATIDVWTSDQEASVMPASEAILGAWSHPSEPTALSPDDTALRHLLASVIPVLADRRIRSLQRSVATDNTVEATTLIATNFSRTSTGRLMSKRL